MNTINFDAPSVGDAFVLVKLEAAFPAATKRSPKAEAAIIADMIAKGVDRETAEKAAHAQNELFPDGELKAIKTPFYAFNTYLDRVTTRWVGGKGAPKLLSVHMLDKVEQRFADAQLVMLPLWQKFRGSYSHTVDNLSRRLAGYFDKADYLTPEELDNRFKFELTFTPIGDPSQFDMGVVSEAQKQRMQEAVDRAATEANKLYAKTLHDSLTSLRAQLLGGKVNGKFVRFSEANVNNLVDMVEANLNAAGSSELASALQDVDHAAKMAAQAARYKDDKGIRTSAANAADRAAKALAGLM